LAWGASRFNGCPNLVSGIMMELFHYEGLSKQVGSIKEVEVQDV